MTPTIASEAVTLSPLDSERFGIRAARAYLTANNFCEVLESCESEKVDLLIARCRTDNLVAAQSAEAQGFLLMDTLLYYQFDLLNGSIPQRTSEFPVRSLRPGDEYQVHQIAASAFRNYPGHYHADFRLDRRKCDEAYASWAERSCVPGLASDKVLVAECEGLVMGFGTLRLNSSDEVEGLLFAISPQYQQRGICGLLMMHSLEWARGQGALRMIISTQLTNVSMQKVWSRTGFELSHSFYTFHKWFDR